MTKKESEKHTRFEKARMIGSRALQIGMGAKPLVKLSEKDMEKIKYNPIEIAKMEYEQGMIPIEVKRPAPKRSEEKKSNGSQ